MPATGVRCTFIMRGDLLAITETHVFVSSPSLDDAQVGALKLFKLRLALSGFPTRPVALRMSVVGSPRVFRTLGDEDLAGIAPVANNYKDRAGNFVNNNADQSKACLQLSADYADTKHKRIYLAGVPDVVLGDPDEPGHIVDNAWWLALFNSWRNELTGRLKPWGFIARTDPAGVFARVQVQAASNQVGTQNFGVAVLGAIPNANLGTLLQTTRFKRNNVAFRSQNGTFQISAIDVNVPANGFTTYYFRDTSGIASSTITRLGFVQPIDYTTFKYQRIEIDKDTTRKRGNRVLATPGRRTIRKFVAT